MADNGPHSYSCLTGEIRVKMRLTWDLTLFTDKFIAVCLLSALAIALGGCAFSAKYPVLTFESSMSHEEKEEVSIPIDPENLEWIQKSCPSGKTITSRKYREITPYGVVFRKIQCLPEDEAQQRPPVRESGPVVTFEPTVNIEVVE